MAPVKISRRGFALVFSLFLVMVLYTGMTIMMADLKSDVQVSSQAFRSAQNRAASQGAVNKLLVLLRNGESLDRYTKDSPLKVEIGQFEEVQAWVVEDENSGVYHLVSNFGGTSYSRVITQNDELGARTYINDGGVLKSAAPGGSSWSTLPEPPQRLYRSDGEVWDLDAEDTMLCWENPSANANGQIVGGYQIREGGEFGRALYLFDEQTRSWTDVTPPNPSQSYFYDAVEPFALGDNQMFTWLNPNNEGEFRHFDIQSKTWSNSIRAPYDGGRIEAGFAGPNNTFVAGVKDNYNVLHAVEYVNGEWRDLPPLPDNVVLTRLNTDGPEGEIYATGQNDELYCYKDGEWSGVSAPYRAENLLSVDAAGALIFRDNARENYYRCEESSDPVKLPDADDVRGVAGGGVPGETQGDGFKMTATY